MLETLAAMVKPMWTADNAEYNTLTAGRSQQRAARFSLWSADMDMSVKPQFNLKGTLTDFETNADSMARIVKAREGAPNRRWRTPSKKQGRVIVQLLAYYEGESKPKIGAEVRAEQNPGGVGLTVWPYKNRWPDVKESWEILLDELRKRNFDPQPAAGGVAPGDGKESGKGKPLLPEVSALKKHFPKGSMITARRILKAIPQAYADCEKSGGRWGPGEISKGDTFGHMADQPSSEPKKVTSLRSGARLVSSGRRG